MIRIFIGYDPKETVAYNVLCHSIVARSTQPVSITPLRLSHLKDYYSRPTHPLQSTEFSFSRFLTPYLSQYEGWSIFMDNDILNLEDISRLWSLRDDRYAVQVVKHDHQPKEDSKFLGMPQTKYEKKNWSSVMLFNNAKCRALTPEFVNQASGLELHQFKWLEHDDLIGNLPNKWNHLVGYDQPRNDAALVHFTLGGPYFSEFKNCEYSSEWFKEREDMLFCQQRENKK